MLPWISGLHPPSDAPGAAAIPAAPPGASHCRRPLLAKEAPTAVVAADQPMRRGSVSTGSSQAAARLGMKRSTLQFRMRKLGIRVARTGA